MREMLQRPTCPRLPVSESGGLLRRKCRNTLDLGCGLSEKAEPSTVPAIVHEVLNSPGRPLDPQTSAFMGSRLGHDFSQVCVHTDERAATSARAVKALAYTVGRDVVFGAGQYAPHTTEGRRLVAHELTHVVQQGGEHASASNLKIGPRDSAAEHEAAENAASVSTGRAPRNVASSPGTLIQRDPPPQSAPIESERGVTVTPHLDPNHIDLTMGILSGQHRFRIRPGLSNPLNIFGTPIPGMSPSQLSLIVGYENRCNRAIQGALIEWRQTQPPGLLSPSFGNPNEIQARGSFRLGSWLIEPGGTIGFTGNTLDTALFTLSLTPGVSTRIPPECIAPPPEPTREPDRPTPTPDPDTGTHDDDTGRTPGGEVPTTQPRPPATLPSYTIYFFYDTTMTRPESNATFQNVLTMLQTVPSLHVMLSGHASLEGTDPYNMRLSRERADAIRLQLSLEGIAASRIHTTPFGETAPAVPEPDVGTSLLPSVERIRNLNRRVEVTFFDPTGSFGPLVPQLTLPTLGWRRRSGLERPSLGTPRLEQ